MPDNSVRLLKLAEAEFPDLTEPEREVVRCVAVGEPADLSPLGPPRTDQSQDQTKKRFNPGGRRIRTSIVEWICLNNFAKRLVHRNGLCIANATLDNELGLNSLDIPFAFVLYQCMLFGLSAQGANFGSSLKLDSCKILGTLDIHSAHITGQLILKNSRIINLGSVALRANSLTIDCDIFIFDDTRIIGEVSLVGADINGDLACRNGKFLNKNGISLNADRASIKGIVFLSEGFLAIGPVNLLGIRIKCSLECIRGKFLSKGKYSLIANRSKIGGSVFLSQGYKSIGETMLSGAIILGNLECCGGTFLNNENSCAINLEHTRISGALILEPEKITGEINALRMSVTQGLRMHYVSQVRLMPSLPGISQCSVLDLTGAKVGLLTDCTESWPKHGSLCLDGFEYDNIDCYSPLSPANRLEWLSRMPTNIFYPQPYEQLAAWFQRTGHDSEAREVRIAKEELHRKLFTRRRDKFWWWLKFWTIGYGYKPYRAIYCLIAIWLLFACLFYFAYPAGMTQSVSYQYAAVNNNATYGTANATNYPEFNALVYSLDVALPIIDLQQERYWMPNSEATLSGYEFWRCGALLWWANWTEVLLGWFFASMGIAGATGIIRKD